MRDFSGGRRTAASLYIGLFFMAAAASWLMVDGCRKPAAPSSDLKIEASITPQPIRTGTETISFRLLNAANSPVTGAHVQLEGDMNHPGMAPVFADAVEVMPGDYKAAMNFTMGGDWTILFHVALRDGPKVERQMDVRGVESN